ncbi:MAG: hypothetical protein ACYDA2_10540 [Acidimicrobiales bacterium]
MVSALHNACLRMEASGTTVEDIVSPSGLHRWLGRGGLAVGGAASLVFGALLGGALESVPVLLPPPASAAGAPEVLPNGLPVTAPLELAANVLPGFVVPAPVPAAQQVANTLATPPAVGAPAAGTIVKSGPAPAPSKPVVHLPAPPPSSPSNPTPPPSSPVTSVVQTVTGDLGGAVSSVTGTLQQTVTLGAPSVSSPVTGIVSGVSSTVNKVGSTVGGLTQGSSGLGL